MRQFTTPDQTAKLIELGFEKPKSEVKAEQAGDNIWYNPAYSIGELIEMLDGVSGLEITRSDSGWDVYDDLRASTCEELIDALYDMVVQLKKAGVI